MERNYVYSFVYQIEIIKLGNGDAAFIVLQSRINCSFRVVVRKLKAAHAQREKKKAWKWNLHARLHPSSTGLLSAEHCARSSSPLLKAGFHLAQQTAAELNAGACVWLQD